MDIFGITCFAVSAKQLNFTQASKFLNVSQPTLSRIIAMLEQELNTPLFIRNKKSLELTCYGKRFLQYAEQILCLYDKARVDAANPLLVEKDRISIAFHAYTSSYCLPNLVRYCSEHYPDIKLDLIDKERSEIPPMISSGQADLGIFAYWGQDSFPNCTTEPLFEDEYCAVLSSSHHLASEEMIDPTQLTNETFCYCEHYDAYLKQADSGNYIFRQISQEYDVDFRHRCHVNTMLSLMLLIECNHGFSILPDHCKRWAGRNVRFIPLRRSKKGNTPKFQALYAYRSDGMTPALTHVLDALTCLRGSKTLCEEFAITDGQP